MREIISGNIYHVFSRGVDKRKLFLDDEDHLRFIHDLFEFNDETPENNNTYYFNQMKQMKREQSTDIASPYISKRKPRKLLVEILVFCLMPNHYHLLVKPKSDKGLFWFMKKLNIGYAKYFNEKYERKGALFEGRYKSVLIKDESHFVYIPYYVHFNPLDLIMPKWREGEIKNYKKAIKFLENYRWSSLKDYIGEKNFPSVTQRDFLLNFFEGTDQYKKNMRQWLRAMNLEKINDILE